jgi:heterodisulfide reductase subunit A2
METDVLIVGGGIAGLRSAWELSKMDIVSAIVEKRPFPGGHVARFSCKATDRCRRCGACQLEDVWNRVTSSPRIARILNTTLERIERKDRRFTALLDQRPARILSEKCTECRLCEGACPESGAISRSPLDNRLFLDESVCRYFKDHSCEACAEICPEGAVALDAAVPHLQVEASAVILATGFKPYDAREKPRFGYGLVPGVVTALELDSSLRQGDFNPTGSEGPIRSVAFIQCVGSRDAKIGRNYCSRVCCGNALRTARLLRSRMPSMEPTMFYMDIQTFDREFEKRLGEAAKEVRLIRSIPSEVRTGRDGRPLLTYHGPDDQRVAESFDLVVLSVGIDAASPGPVAELLHLESNRDGFLGEDGEEVRTSEDGVFVAGTVQSPRSIAETISHAIRASGEAATYLGRISRGRVP